MAQQIIDIGSVANDGTGDPLRTAYDKANDNFSELYGVFPVVGSWTPVLTFATPGNLAVAYTAQVGRYIKIGKLVMAEFVIVTSSFTHSTASGNMQVTGLPFSAEAVTNMSTEGVLNWAGITKAGVGSIALNLPSADNKMTARYSGSGIANGQIAIADVPTGGSVVLRGAITYITT